MRKAALLCAVLLSVGLVHGGDFYKQYWGGDETGCLYPASDSGNTFTVVGVANATAAVNEGQPFDPCYTDTVTDGPAGIIKCDAANACEVTYTLTDLDPDLPTDIQIGVVSVWYIVRQDVDTAKNTADITVSYVISSTEYEACFNPMAVDDEWIANSRVDCGYGTRNPATNQRWTIADLNGLQIKVEKQFAGTNSGLEVTAIGVGVGYARDF